MDDEKKRGRHTIAIFAAIAALSGLSALTAERIGAALQAADRDDGDYRVRAEAAAADSGGAAAGDPEPAIASLDGSSAADDEPWLTMLPSDRSPILPVSPTQHLARAEPDRRRIRTAATR